MNDKAQQVGVSQRLRAEWLEATVNLILAGNGGPAIRVALDAMLASKLSVRCRPSATPRPRRLWGTANRLPGRGPRSAFVHRLGRLDGHGRQGGLRARQAAQVSDVKVAAWLAEAVLRSPPGDGPGTANPLRHPCLFPYRLPPLAASQLAAHSRRLEALRQGLDEEVLMLLGP